MSCRPCLWYNVAHIINIFQVNERASFAPSVGAVKSRGRSPGVKEQQQDEDVEEKRELENLEKIMEGGRTKTPSPPPR